MTAEEDSESDPACTRVCGSGLRFAPYEDLAPLANEGRLKTADLAQGRGAVAPTATVQLIDAIRSTLRSIAGIFAGGKRRPAMAFAPPATLPSRRAQRHAAVVSRSLRHKAQRRVARMSFDAGLEKLRSAGCGGQLPGTVYLVGAGPGEGSLLTLRGRSLLERADVVLYDRLAGSDALRHTRPDATLVYVGKRAGYHTRSQEEISALLGAFASTHDVVVRLKGGDPFVYGRGGEEAAYLRERGVRVEIVPGITAASAVAAGLGFPLTHRGVADSLRFVTGHARAGGTPPAVRWEPGTTLVLYMGLAQLESIVKAAAAQGMPASTPAVAVEQASTPRQRVAWGTAGTLHANVQEVGLKSPTLVVIGDVVALAPGWAEVRSEPVPLGRAELLTNIVPDLREEDRALLAEAMGGGMK